MTGLFLTIDRISEFFGKLSAWIYFSIGFFITYEIIVRNDIVRQFLGTAPTIWVDELSRVLQVWAAYLGAAYVLKEQEMVTIDVAFKNSNSLARRLAETVALMFMLVFAGVSVFFGFQLWLKSTLAGHTTDSFLGLPKWFTHSSVWVGFALLFFQSLAQVCRVWNTKKINRT